MASLEGLAHDPVMLGLALALATLVTEDGTLIAGALLASGGYADPSFIILAIALGITLGDIGLYGVGVLAGKWRWLKLKINADRLSRLNDWLQPRQSKVLFFSRFLPGTRLPTYLAFGYLKLSLLHFTIIMALASALWVSGMVLLVSVAQNIFTALLGPWAPLFGIAFAVTLIFGLPRLLRRSQKLAPVADKIDENQLP